MAGASEDPTLVLLVGDLHVPFRSSSIPKAFQRILMPEKMHYVLCTGNLCSYEQMNSLRSLAPDGARFKAVAGDFDSEAMGLPDQEVFSIGSFKFVMNHGHSIVPWGDLEALSMLQRKHGADIVISGHTHENSVHEYEGKLYVNPGSLTGAYSSITTEPTPSFCVLSILGDNMTVYIYTLEADGTQRTEEVTYSRAAAAPAKAVAGGGAASGGGSQVLDDTIAL